MNSEELELSLRSEFEAYMNAVLADVQQRVTDFQQKIDSELEKHRVLMDEAFKDFSSRLTIDRPTDKAFTESVVEHLRIARDDGARVAASALAEAEAMGADSGRMASISLTRDAVNDISSQTSQSSILHTLVFYAEQFCPRGVFFIVRNERFVGWQALGRDAKIDEATVREISFATLSDTVLSDAVRNLATAEREYTKGSGDEIFLDPLGFGQPTKMYAIPLVARGRGVAALYVDGGRTAHAVNIEALEMLVRVASLTVELLASNQAARPQVAEIEHQAPAREPEAQREHPVARPEPEAEVQAAEPVAEATEPQHEEYKFDTVPQWEPPATEPEVHEVPAYEVETFEPAVEEAVEVQEIQEIQVEAEEIIPDAPEAEARVVEATTDFSFHPSEEAEPEPASYTDEAESSETPVHANGNGHAVTVLEAVDEPPTPRPISGTRQLDLPIAVSEAERGTHTKARRFARLLVSEIKLYNEDKVRQGRESGDLYDRLREAIDRSREMYDKRVEPPVASTFDYFHYELVNDLAQGDVSRLGGSYPGAAV